MAKFEFGMTSRRGRSPAGRVLAALVAIGFCASACSMIDQFNPFGPEKYKMEITPDTPASKTYDQGLEKLANGVAAGGGEEIHRTRQAISRARTGPAKAC